MDFIIDFAAVMVLPAAIFSFSRYVARDEYKALRDSGQKLNLNMANLRSARRRAADDPLRESHLKIARIGRLHWIAVPVALLALLLFGAALELLR
ncbi:hypothetical protein ACQ5SO_01470 [Rhodovulum sp. DZ06]|uniref:hypothetical protein n=1 Tax=Rhodovulum sp. DZ06 TaxID=3425126 RepID=UPI003D326FFC